MKVFATFSLAMIAMLNTQITQVLAEGEDTPETVSTSESYDFKGSGLQRYSATGSTSTWSRAVSTMISLYVKNGTVPQITKYDGTYNGVAYHVLEADTSDGNTLIKLDYAGSTPKTLNNMYDETLTANDEYYWAGAINAGFFSMSNGYPTGAVRTGGAWQTYNGAGSNYETWECTPAYGSGFTSVYFNRSGNDMKLLYNGWKGGVFYKYYTDPSPNTWDYSPVWDYSEGVSGAYTLMVDGNTGTHWGKGDYGSTDYWNYVGTAITLFGQKANGNYVLLTTSAGSLTANQAIDLMSKLGCTNGIRFDGGGSSQMAYDNGLYIKSISAPKSAEVSSADALSEISVTVYDGNSKAHSVAITDLSDEVSATTADSDGNFTVTAKTVVGDVTVNASVKKEEPTPEPESKSELKATFNNGYATVGESAEDIKKDIMSIKEVTDDAETDIDLSNATIEVSGNTDTADSTVTVTITYGDLSKEYKVPVLDSNKIYYSSDVSIDNPTLKSTMIAKDESLLFTININGEEKEITDVTLDGIDTSKTGVQKGTATYTYYILNKDSNGLVSGTSAQKVKTDEFTIYVQGVEDITINTEKDTYYAGDDLGEVTGEFTQTNVDENASVSDIVFDTSEVNMNEAGTYKISASYTPKATITTEDIELSYSKSSSTALNYDWQLGTNWDIGANESPKGTTTAPLSDLDSKLADGEYSFTKQGSTYFLIGGVDDSEYIRFSKDDTEAYVYKFEPYHWSSEVEANQTLVSSSTNSEWLSTEWVFGTTASKGYKYAGHYDESMTGTLIQNCWSVTRITYNVTTNTKTNEEVITAPVGFTAEKQVVVLEKQPVTHTVNFYDFDGNILDSITAEEGAEVVTDKIPEKEGYTFTKWSDPSTTETGDMDIYPEFACTEGYDLTDGACVLHVDPTPDPDEPETTYHVSFDWNYANGGDVWGLDGVELVVPENGFWKDGYKFVSWNTAMDGSGTTYNPGDVLTSANFGESTSMMLYAQWEKDATVAKVSFDWNYANRGSMPTVLISGGEVLPANTFERDGYLFKGWNTSINGDGTHYDDEATMPTLESDTILYAEWEQDTQYEIHFDWNYANSGQVNNIIAQTHSECVLPENGFSKDNYEFIGWNTSINGDGIMYQPGEALPEGNVDNITLYATWRKTEAAYSYVVSYDWNYANSGSMGVDFGTNSEGYKAPECGFKRDQKVFVSWNTAMDGSGRTIEAGDVVHDIASEDSENIVLYAQWRDAGTTTIIYDWNYANSGSMPTTVAYEGESVQLAKNTFVKYNSQFVGWNTAMDGTGEFYYDEAIVDLFDASKDVIVLYAQWE